MGSAEEEESSELEVAAADVDEEEGYLARWRRLLVQNDPRMLFVGKAKSEAAEERILSASAEGGARGSEGAELARDRRLIAATRSPAFGYIPRPLRLSAFPWVNIPLVIFSLAAATPASLAGVQVVNQAYNALFNLANGASPRSGDQRQFRRRSFFNFLLATATACVVSAAGRGVERAVNIDSVWIRWLVPWVAVASASAVNIVVLRQSELAVGVPVADRSGRCLAKSKAAGRAAVAKALLTRALLLPLVALVVPLLLEQSLQAAAPCLFASSVSSTVCQVALVGVVLGFGLPACIALFPDTLRLPARRLEPEVRAAAEEASLPPAGDPVVYVYRGM